MKFRKKPVVIDAIKWTGSNIEEALKFLADGRDNFNHLSDDGAYVQKGVGYSTVEGIIEISTLEGVVRTSPGDWIIRGIKGEFYPCRQDIFESTYERVEP